MGYSAINWTTVDRLRRVPAVLRSVFDGEDSSRHHGSRPVCPACGDAAVTLFTASRARRGDGYNDGCEMAKCQHCGVAGDVLKWYSIKYGVDRNTAAVKLLGDFAGVDLADVKPARNETATRKQAVDFTEYCEHCRSALVPDSLGWWYLRQMRRFTDEQIKFCRDKYGIGYDKRCNGHPTVILPYDYGGGPVGYWSGRYVEDVVINGRPVRYVNPGTGIKGVFHASRLYDGLDVVFVTESEIETVMVEVAAQYVRGVSVGAVALGGADNHAPLVGQLQDRPTCSRLIAAFDNDGGGSRADVLAGRLAEVGQTCEVWRSELTVGRCQTEDGRAFDDLGDVFAIHGPQITAGFLRAAIEYPQIFCKRKSA